MKFFRFPSNPKDGQQVADHNGNVYKYNKEEDSWILLGVLQTPPIVTEKADGLVSPEIHKTLQLISQQIHNGISYGKDKILIGEDNPYFYYLQSTDNSIKFTPEILVTGKKRLRVEVNRPGILQKFTRVPCPGQTGPRGVTGDPGRPGTPAPKECPLSVIFEESSNSASLATSVAVPTHEPISIRLFRGTGQVIEILRSVVDDSVSYSSVPGYTVDEKNSSVILAPDPKRLGRRLLSVHLVLSEGVFSGSWVGWAMQRGEQGPPGRDGVPYLDVVIISDTWLVKSFISFVDVFDSAISYVNSGLDNTVCTGSLKLATATLPRSRYAAAIEEVTKTCKSFGYYSPDEIEITIPDLTFPAWTPLKRCADARRYAISNLDWTKKLEATPEGDCGAIAFPFEIIMEPVPPTHCCRDDFFMCGNLGDSCPTTGVAKAQLPTEPNLST